MNSKARRTAARSAGPPRQTRTASGGAPSVTKASLANAPAMVLVNSRHDPATPYAGAVRAHALLPASRLVTWEGEDHTSMFGGHSCIDDAVVAYLVSRTLPETGLSCPATGG